MRVRPRARVRVRVSARVRARAWVRVRLMARVRARVRAGVWDRDRVRVTSPPAEGGAALWDPSEMAPRAWLGVAVVVGARPRTWSACWGLGWG